MKEYPILFKGPLVLAIREDRKTVTRRLLEGQMAGGWTIADPAHPLATITSSHPKKGKFGLLIRREIHPGSGKFEHDVIPSPYGRPGDQLWVRESWAADRQVDSVSPGELSQGEPICYLADGAVRSAGCAMISRGKGRPSIHMPRWVSRIQLEVTGVRVERLHEITESQAEAEGAERWDVSALGADELDLIDMPLKELESPYRNGFALLWETTGGSWEANPWVWVYEFKRIESGRAAA